MENNLQKAEELSDKMEMKMPLAASLKPSKVTKDTHISCYTLSLTFISAIGGFLFGFNTGVISGAMIMMDNVFPMSSFNKQVFVSITMAAAMIFALISGFTNDFIGRKKTIMLASVIYIIGGVVLASAQHIMTLFVGRFIIGIGMGFSSMTIPMYIAECSPRSQRGLLVTLNGLFLTAAQFVSCIVCGLASPYKLHGWRVALGLGALPAFLQLILFTFLPESPRWLAANKRPEEAERVLMRIEKDEEVVQEEMASIRKAVLLHADVQEAGAVATLWKVVRTGHVMRALLIGTMLQVIQQVAGINVVMYYSATIVQMSGVNDSSNAIWLSALIAFFNFTATFIGIPLVERMGRRLLTLFSLFGSFIGLLVLGIGFTLVSLNTPPVSHSLNSSCAAYRTCEGCVTDPGCNYCYQPADPAFRNSFCFSDGFSTPNHLNNAPHYNNNTNNNLHNNNTNNNLHNNNTNNNLYNNNANNNPPISNQCSNIYNHSLLNQHQDNNGKFGKAEWKVSTKYCSTPYSWLATFGMVVYLIFFAPGMGPMPWTINSEIYPSWARSTCVSVATSVNWLCNMVVAFTFLSLIDAISSYGVFFMYAALALVSLLLLFLLLPETKNKSLEEIEELFKGPFIVSNKHSKILSVYED